MWHSNFHPKLMGPGDLRGGWHSLVYEAFYLTWLYVRVEYSAKMKTNIQSKRKREGKKERGGRTLRERKRLVLVFFAGSWRLFGKLPPGPQPRTVSTTKKLVRSFSPSRYLLGVYVRINEPQKLIVCGFFYCPGRISCLSSAVKFYISAFRGQSVFVWTKVVQCDQS